MAKEHRSQSYAVYIRMQGETATNSLRFGSQQEAEQYGKDVAKRLSTVEEVQVVGTKDKPTHKWVGNAAVELGSKGKCQYCGTEVEVEGDSTCAKCEAATKSVAEEIKEKEDKTVTTAVAEKKATEKAAQTWDNMSRKERMVVILATSTFPGNVNKDWADISPKLHSRLESGFAALEAEAVEVETEVAEDAHEAAASEAAANSPENTKPKKVRKAKASKSGKVVKNTANPNGKKQEPVVSKEAVTAAIKAKK